VLFPAAEENDIATEWCHGRLTIRERSRKIKILVKRTLNDSNEHRILIARLVDGLKAIQKCIYRMIRSFRSFVSLPSETLMLDVVCICAPHVAS
jgi:hypothetical protein